MDKYAFLAHRVYYICCMYLQYVVYVLRGVYDVVAETETADSKQQQTSVRKDGPR